MFQSGFLPIPRAWFIRFCVNVSFVCGTFCDIFRVVEWFRNWEGLRKKPRWFYRVTIPLFACKIACVRAEIWNDPSATRKYYTNLLGFLISSGSLLTLNISHILIYFLSFAGLPLTYISFLRCYTWLQSSLTGSTFRMLVSGRHRNLGGTRCRSSQVGQWEMHV